jgi:signal peptidase I
MASATVCDPEPRAPLCDAEASWNLPTRVLGIDGPPAALAKAHSQAWLIAKKILRALAIVLLVRTFIGEASVVPTASMENTVLVGDHLFWDKALYGPEIPFLHWRLPSLRKVRREELVAFRFPRDPEQIYLKRVVGVGGDVVALHNGALEVNGRPVEESYAVHEGPYRSDPRFEQMAPRKVPAGELFVLGDNRENSSDSRDWGFVPESNVIGEPLVVVWSYNAPSADWLEQRAPQQIEFMGSILAHFWTRTRWSRIGLRPE